MMKWIQNNIKDKETLSSVEKKILTVKSKITGLNDEKIAFGLDEDDRFSLVSKDYEKKRYAKRKNNLDGALEQLKTKRQYFLDRRNGWVSRALFSVIVPVIIIVISAVVLAVFGLS